eukprot:scaffold23161_cov25-Tisochrysis_lutea.AAC.1
MSADRTPPSAVRTSSRLSEMSSERRQSGRLPSNEGSPSSSIWFPARPTCSRGSLVSLGMKERWFAPAHRRRRRTHKASSSGRETRPLPRKEISVSLSDSVRAPSGRGAGGLRASSSAMLSAIANARCVRSRRTLGAARPRRRRVEESMTSVPSASVPEEKLWIDCLRALSVRSSSFQSSPGEFAMTLRSLACRSFSSPSTVDLKQECAAGVSAQLGRADGGQVRVQPRTCRGQRRS